MRSSWLLDVRNHLPVSVLDKSWIRSTPPFLEQTSQLLRRIHKLHQARQYREALTPSKKNQLAQKLAASEIFAERKANYPQSVSMWFIEDRLEPHLAKHPLRPNFDKVIAQHPEVSWRSFD